MTSSRALAPRVLPQLIALDWTLRVLTMAGLFVDCFVHAKYASQYDPIPATIGEGDLFRVEAAVAGLAMVLVLIGTRLTWAFAFLVATGGFAAVMVYGTIDVGAFGPFTDMYDPSWSPEQVWSAAAEGFAMVTGFAGLVLAVRRRSRPSLH